MSVDANPGGGFEFDGGEDKSMLFIPGEHHEGFRVKAENTIYAGLSFASLFLGVGVVGELTKNAEMAEQTREVLSSIGACCSVMVVPSLMWSGYQMTRQIGHAFLIGREK